MQASFDGRVGFADGLQLAANVADVRCARLRELARWLGAPWPAGSGLQDFRARGQLEWQEGVLAFQEAVFQMDGNVASGALSVGLGERTAIDGTLALARLDLTAYLPPAAGASKDTRTRLEAAWLALTGDPVDYAFPHQGARRGHPHLGRPRGGARQRLRPRCGDPVDPGRQDARRRGRARARPRRARRRACHARHDRAGAALRRARQARRLRGGAPGAAAFDYPPLLSGAGGLLDLAATGATRTALAGTLAGKIMLHVGEGGRLGIDLEALMAAARAKELAGWAAGRGSTTVDEIVARFRVSGGTIGVEAVKLQTGGRSIVGTGGIDFANREIDVQLMLAPPAPAVAPGSRGAPAADRLSVQGPWIAPAIRWMPEPTRPRSRRCRRAERASPRPSIPTRRPARRRPARHSPLAHSPGGACVDVEKPPP